MFLPLISTASSSTLASFVAASPGCGNFVGIPGDLVGNLRPIWLGAATRVSTFHLLDSLLYI